MYATNQEKHNYYIFSRYLNNEVKPLKKSMTLFV